MSGDGVVRDGWTGNLEGGCVDDALNCKREDEEFGGSHDCRGEDGLEI